MLQTDGSVLISGVIFVFIQNWKPWPDLDSSPGGKTPSPSCSKHPPAKVPPRSKLPNPFMSLNPNAQALVKDISEMGFALPRVARACQLLGEDYKEVSTVLLPCKYNTVILWVWRRGITQGTEWRRL